KESKVILLPWSKLRRDTLEMEGGMAVVILDQGEVRDADVQNGRGVRRDPDRQGDFAADEFKLHFVEGGGRDRLAGNKNGRLVSTTSTMRTTVTSNHLDLEFETSTKESALKSAVATGSSVAEAVPIAKPGAETGDTRVLRSDVITMKMKNGGGGGTTPEKTGARADELSPTPACPP